MPDTNSNPLTEVPRLILMTYQLTKFPTCRLWHICGYSWV